MMKVQDNQERREVNGYISFWSMRKHHEEENRVSRGGQEM
jgi:hypothetical protein